MKTALSLFILLFLVACNIDNVRVDERPFPVFEVIDFLEDDIPFSSAISWDINFDKKATLGRILFYDKQLSLNNSISCGNCHIQKKGFCDDVKLSTGLFNEKTKRNSMALVNNAYQRKNFWEGHAGRLEEHILSPISNHIEMGMASPEALADKLNKIDDYTELFSDVYNSEASELNIQESLTAFVSSLVSYNSKFDQGKDLGFSNYSLSEKAGKNIFFGKAKCAHCHKGDHFVSTWRLTANIGLETNYEDQGSGNGKFKVPSLRNVELTGPYMHDGRFDTLEEVIEHYSSGVKDHPQLDWTLESGGIGLNDLEKSDLLAFLKTLTDYEFINDPRFSDPF